MPAPLRPRSATELFLQLINNAQDDAGDTNTQIYDSEFVTEQATITDSVTVSTNAPPFTYGGSSAKYGLSQYS